MTEDRQDSRKIDEAQETVYAGRIIFPPSNRYPEGDVVPNSMPHAYMRPPTSDKKKSDTRSGQQGHGGKSDSDKRKK